MDWDATTITAIATSTVALGALIAGVRYVFRAYKLWKACKKHPDEPSNLSGQPTESWLEVNNSYLEIEAVMANEATLGFPKSNHTVWTARCKRCHKSVATGAYSFAV